MGYACPVCGDPQADGRHLANHLAFTAIARGGDHEAWLDEHVPDWGEMGEDSLGERVADHAAETEFPRVFDDTTDQGMASDRSHGHRHSGGHEHSVLDDAQSRTADGTFADDASDVLEEARELTRRRRENAADSDSPPADESETRDARSTEVESAEAGSAGESDDSETE